MSLRLKFIALCALVAHTAAEHFAAAAEPSAAAPAAMQTIDIILEGPAEAKDIGKAEIQLRIFEADDPDAPPQVSTISLKTVPVDALTLPMTIQAEVPKSRLLGALRPAVGAVVLSNGNMAYWNNEIVPLSRSGPTTVKLAKVP